MSVIASTSLLVGLISSSIAGYSAWKCFEQRRRRSRHRDKVRKKFQGGNSSKAADVSSLNAWAIAFAERQSKAISFGHGRRLLPAAAANVRGFDEWIERAGLAGRVTEHGFCEARLKLTFVGMAAGFVLGLLFSAELGVILMLVGGVIGWRLLNQAIKHRTQWRSSEMERHLPEMLDVVAIGMRSGLSFDRSLDIYSSRFPTLLAEEFANAERKWTSGLERRDDALRKVALSYDSVVFSRVIESVIRSLRFGSSMVEGLEAAAKDARAAYGIRRQEQVAKAPVKMMVPTGTLILPAMLILVLGPVLLELIGGGI